MVGSVAGAAWDTNPVISIIGCTISLQKIILPYAPRFYWDAKDKAIIKLQEINTRTAELKTTINDYSEIAVDKLVALNKAIKELLLYLPPALFQWHVGQIASLGEAINKYHQNQTEENRDAIQTDIALPENIDAKAIEADKVIVTNISNTGPLFDAEATANTSCPVPPTYSDQMEKDDPAGAGPAGGGRRRVSKKSKKSKKPKKGKKSKKGKKGKKGKRSRK